MKQKIFKTLDEQVKIFESKGLIINDYDKASEILFKENYFFVNGYRHLLMKNDQPNRFVEGATFDELYAIFLFDRMIRNIMFKYILIIENNIKSIISYQLSKKYGYKEKDYLNPKNFKQDNFKISQVNDILNKMKRQIRLNSKQHRATMHYITNYGYIPLWVSVKVLSFGIISELYSILKEDDQTEIANFYKLNVSTLNIYLALLSNYRNLCAHEDILYDHTTQRSIPDNKFHDRLAIAKVDEEYIYGKNDLFAVIIMMKQMISDTEFRELMNEISYEIDILDGKIESVSTQDILNKIGFPNNWREIYNIE
ncbi:MAG: Abi family protein [Bacilli bacterium]